MLPQIPPQSPYSHPFAGIFEKLIRADQDIANLQTEIDSFFQSGQYPVVPHPDDEAWQEAVDYHRDRVIPPRFGVLAGEAIHHLRSCLDHVVWHFSDSGARAKPHSIEYPIFENKPDPALKREVERYERKIEGIKNAKVRDLIEKSQPYHAGADAANDRLLIIHKMDIIDKHRELMIVAGTANISVPDSMTDLTNRLLRLQNQGEGSFSKSDLLLLGHAAKNYGKVTPGVAFRQFGKSDVYPVNKGLFELWWATKELVDKFALEV